jgi:hypothetical protein
MQSFDSSNFRHAAALDASLESQAPIFDFMLDESGSIDCCWEEQGYRALINSELKRQERPITFLVGPLGRSRSYVGRVLSGKNKLTQQLREKAFAALGIDPIRANIAVAWLRDVSLYHAMEIQHTSDYFREYLEEITSVRNGCIRMTVKPAVLREAAKRTIDAIMQHQDRVIANETVLLG